MRISMPPRLRCLLLGTSALTALVSAAQAGQPGLPTGGVVTAGQAAIAQAGSQMTIATGTARTVIDWQDFSIAGGNKVAIQQPTAASITVNEVTGPNPSRIFGDLSSNGRVVLANPNGLWFGPDAHVDVAGLVASTATLSDAARKAFASGGRLSLDTAGKATASIVNDGRITIANQGLAALVAPGVRNNGVIEATLGSVTLASGQASTLDFYGDGLVALAVTAPVTALALDPEGKPFRATIENNGRIAAGHVLVTADVVKGVVDSVINMSGVTEAKGVTVSGGDIVLDGGDGGVAVAGTLDAASAKAMGGSVQVTGGAVTVAATANVDASGAQGGGTIQLGGGPHGGGSLRHAKTTTIAAGARVAANATVQGNGGTVSVWSDGATRFDGAISARGAGTGNGGWVETSSTGALGVGAMAKVDTGAPGGKTGSWLLDPHDITIQSGGADQYNPSQDSNPTNQDDLTIDPAALARQAGTVTLAASHNLTVSSALTMSSVGSLTLIGQNLIEIDAPITLTQAGANLTLTGGSAINIAANISVPNGFSASVGAGGTFTQAASSTITASGAAGSVAIYDSATASGATIDIAGTINAPDIYLLASDHQSSQAGQILLQGAVLNNTMAFFDALDAPTRADTILYAGPGGAISIGPGTRINGGSANVAFIADAVTIGTGGTPATISSLGRVIVAPASSDGQLQGGVALPDPFGSANYLIQTAVPGGGAPVNIGVGGSGDAYTVSQSLIDLMSGTGGTGASPVERLQIGLPGSSATMTFRGPVNFPADTSFDAENMIVTTGAALTNSGSSTFSFGMFEPSALIFTLTQTTDTTMSRLDFQSGSSITSVGTIQVGTGCYSDTSCGIVPAMTFAGTMAGTNVAIFNSNQEDQGAAGLAVTVAGSSVMTATGVPNTLDPFAGTGITIETGRGGSLSISGGANFNANRGVIGLYTDRLALSGTPALTAASINIDTGTAGNMAFPGATNPDGQFVQEEPVITLGASNGTAAGLALSSATLATLWAAAGATPVTIGDIARPGMGGDTPVLVDVVGSVTLPTNTTIAADAFTQAAGATISAGTLTIDTRVPTNIPGPADGSDVQPVLPTASITLGGTIDAGGNVTLLANAVNGAGSINAGNVILESAGDLTIGADLTVSGLLSARVGPGRTFTQTEGSSLTSDIGVVVYDTSTAAGSTLSIGGTITAPEIYLLASDHQSNQGGQIVLQSTGNLTNTNFDGSQDGSNRAATILYAGPGGGITLDPGMTILGGRTNVALISDSLTVNGGSSTSTVFTFGRVIVAPASTDGDLQVDGAVALPDAFAGNSPFLLNFAPPAGVGTLASIGVVDGAGSYRLSQAALSLLGGVPITLDGFPIMSVARFQIGLPGSTNTENFAGAITLPTETGNFAGNINIAGNTTITIPDNSIQTFDTDGAVPGMPSGLFLSLDETANSTGSGISIAAGARIDVPGNIQMSSTCYSDSCTVTPTVFIGGSLTTGSAFFYSGSGKDQVTVAPGALISSTGRPDIGGIDIEAAGLSLGGTLQSTGGTIDLGTPVRLIGNAAIGSANGEVDLGSVDGAFGLTIDSGTGVVMTGTIGAQAALSSLTIDAGAIDLASATTSGAQTYDGAIDLNGSYAASGFTALGPALLTGNTTVTVGAGGILFGGTIDGGFDLTLNAAAVALRGAAGAKAALASLTATAGTISLGNVTTTGAQAYAGAMAVGGTYTANGFTTGGPMVMLADTTINGGTGDITLGDTVDGAFKLALTSSDANIFFFGTVGTAAARLSLLSIDGADTVTVEATAAKNVSLFVHDFTATHVAGLISVGDHSLESDDSVDISAGSLEGHATAADLTIVTTGNVSGNFVATGTSRIRTGGDFTGSLQTRSGTIVSGGDINGTITGTGAISLTAANVTGTVVSGGLAQISARGTISGSVTGNHVDLSAPTINENIMADSASISSDNVTVTGLVGGVDAGVVQATSSNITQLIEGATQQIADNGGADGGGAKSDDDTTEDDKKKPKGKGGAVYDFANQYIDDLISGKPAH
jgi:filamentous hemagglutinin family protein